MTRSTAPFSIGTKAPPLLALAVFCFLCAQAGADAPPGRFLDNGNGTVTDKKTGLLWQQAVDPKTETWANAKLYCSALVLAGAGGWRLPSVKELSTIVDPRTFDPALDTRYFQIGQETFFWTSTPRTGDATKAYYVWFADGSAHTFWLVVGQQVAVRCVR